VASHGVSEFQRIDARQCTERGLDIETVLRLIVGRYPGAYHLFATSRRRGFDRDLCHRAV